MAGKNARNVMPLKLLLVAVVAAVLVGCNGGKDGIQFGHPTVAVKGLNASNAKAVEYEYEELVLEVQLGLHEDALLEFTEDGTESFQHKVQDRKNYTLVLNTATDLCGFVVETEEGVELEQEVSSKKADATFLVQCEEPEPPVVEDDDEDDEDDDDEEDEELEE